MKKLINILFLINAIHLSGQSVILGDSEPVCLEEYLSPSVSTSSISTLSWDFCFEDLNTSPILSDFITLTGLDDTESLRIVYDSSNWYTFVGSRLTNELYRLDFGSSLENTPTFNNLGSLGVSNLRPYGLEFFKEDDVWYGFVVSQSGDLIRLSFQNTLEGDFEIENLGDLGPYSGIVDLDIKRDYQSSVWYASILDVGQDNISFLSFGSSLSNTPVIINNIGTPDNASITNPRGIEMIQTPDGWFTFISDRDSELVILAEFGTSLSNSPSFRNIATIIDPIHLKIKREGLGYSLFVLAANNGLYRVDFSSNAFDDFTLQTLGDFDGAIRPADVFDVVYDFPAWKMFVVDKDDLELYRFDISGTCLDITIDSSVETAPSNLQYSNPGEYFIEVHGKDNFGNVFSDSDTVTILPQTAPSISFTTDNACVSFEGSFDADTPDLTYSWDFGDGSPTESSQNPSHQFAASGTYTVRLDVDNGTCSNFTEQEITIYEEPPVPDFEVVGNLCADGEITFNNLTDDALYEGPISYEWNFNEGQGTATTRDASFVFGGAGMKTVTLTSSIPGCENFSQTVIDLQPGPTSLFSTSSVCQNELMDFTNQSADADSYEWDFGDGFTSTQPDVSHVYTESGNFVVRLEAFDLNGCSAIYEQEVAVSPEPDAHFSYDIACKGNQGVEFIDQSTVEGADILSWEWRVNDQLISTEQSPTLSFDETGNVEVSLTVSSSNGCTKEYEETLNVLEDPDPAFNSEISCQSLVSTFTDTSMNPEEIVSRVWEIEGQTYTTAQVNHTFSGSGQIDVNLTVTGQNFCSSTLYSTVTVPPAPDLDFSISSSCSEEEIIFQDLSTSTDPIVSRSWTLDGTPFFNGPTAVIDELNPGTYAIGLTAVSESGCEFTLSQPLEIFEAPSASFASSASYGVPPFTLNLTNTSSGADGQQWLVNGSEVATSTHTNYTITSEGDYLVELVSTNANGCEDRSSITIISRLPAINLIASNLTLTPNGSSSTISLQVTNNGNLPIEIFDVFVSSSNDFSFSERINQYLEIGEQSNVQLTSVLQTSSAQRICIRIQSAYDDIAPDNNEACINFTPKVVFEDMYPNPFDDEAVVRFILPEASKVRVFIANATGKIISDQTASYDEGLQVLRYNSSQWEKGLYFVTVLYNGEMSTRRVLKF